jgi:hypothetical protein
MGESDPNPKPHCATMTISEVHSLAERLLARGRTVLTDVPEQQGDLRLAAKALLATSRSFNGYDLLMLDRYADIAPSSPPHTEEGRRSRRRRATHPGSGTWRRIPWEARDIPSPGQKNCLPFKIFSLASRTGNSRQALAIIA